MSNKNKDLILIPECWKILCDTDTCGYISQKRFQQIIDRQLRSWGQIK